MANSLAKPLLCFVIGGLSVAVIRHAPGINKLIGIGLGSLTFPYAIEKIKGQKLGDIFDSSYLLVQEITGVIPAQSDNAGAIKLIRREDIESFLSGIMPKSDFTTPNFWTEERSNRSAVIVGQGNSGKSKIHEFRFQQKARNQNIWCPVADPHYDAPVRDGREKTTWLPGISPDEFRKQYLVPNPQATYDLLQKFHQEGERRLQNKSDVWNNRTRQEWHLTIDEWQEHVDHWTDKQTEEAARILKKIANSFDKVGIHFSLVVHSFTEKNTKLDQQVLQACDIYACGTSISTTTNQFPNVNRSELSKEMAETRLSLGGPHQRVIAYRDSHLGEWEIVIAPDLSVEFEFELTQPDELIWLEDCKAKIETLWLDGKSPTKIGEALKIQINNNSLKWLKLKEYISQLEEAAAKEEIA